jgi:hypothetical protein
MQEKVEIGVWELLMISNNRWNVRYGEGTAGRKLRRAVGKVE